MEIPLTVTKIGDLHFVLSPFGSYEEAKAHAMKLLEESPIIMEINIVKRRYDPIWAIEYKRCSTDFFNKYIAISAGE